MFDYNNKTIKEFRNFYSNFDTIETQMYLNEIRKTYLNLEKDKGAFAGLLVLLLEKPGYYLYKWLNTFEDDLQKVQALCKTTALNPSRSFKDNLNGNGKKFFSVSTQNNEFEDILFGGQINESEGRGLSQPFLRYIVSDEFSNMTVDSAFKDFLEKLQSKENQVSEQKSKTLEIIDKQLKSAYNTLKLNTQKAAYGKICYYSELLVQGKVFILNSITNFNQHLCVSSFMKNTHIKIL